MTKNMRPWVYNIKPPKSKWPRRIGAKGYSKHIVDGITLYYKDDSPISRILVPKEELKRLDGEPTT